MPKSSTLASTSIAFLILFFMLHMSCDARILKIPETHMHSKQLLLLKLGFDLHQLKRYENNSTHVSASDRVSPGGPDPQHHF
ncbi:hypothetical protein PVK06_029677 [Gossypium arboreum]|uniref:Uncharacterized protein n=1 Tax=Gossypium arboreum TaxID=29729 RepID=A0ABR0NLH1_GOSAR|nr:hypothetical protein PVK06_029677 [Gossypium arboreum]